jgi:hypothetical protein
VGMGRVGVKFGQKHYDEILDSTVLYCTVSCCTVLYCNAISATCYTILYYTVLYYVAAQHSQRDLVLECYTRNTDNITRAVRTHST